MASEDALTTFTILRHVAAALQPLPPLYHRIRSSLVECNLRLRRACRNYMGDLLLWVRSGSPLHTLLAVSVVGIALFVLMGFLVFMLFFLALTINNIIISSLVSLAAAGGVLALSLCCIMTIYIGELTIAALALYIITISEVIATLLAAGWIGFFYAIWLVAKESMDLTEQPHIQLSQLNLLHDDSTTS